jgi:plastocyanin
MAKKSLTTFTLVAIIVSTVLMLSFSCLAEQAKSPSDAKNTTTILIQNSAFFPTHLTVVKGTTVNWLNADRITYKVKSDKFESKDLLRGDTFSYTFNETGTYNYAEASNPSMKGVITVT